MTGAHAATSEPPTPTPTLVTIGLSHYCEKARWALTYAGAPYREEPHAPGFHVRAVRRAGGKRTTPVLRTRDAVFPESNDILRFADRTLSRERALFPQDGAREEVEALTAFFDTDLGPHVRRYMYFYVLQRRSLALSALTAGAPRFERLTLPFFFPVVRSLMRRSMRIDEAGAERSRAKVEAVFARVDALLGDGRDYLVAGRFTAADLTFAALAAPIARPPNYGVTLPPEDDLAADARAQLERWRATPAARHVLAMYRAHRAAA